MSRAVWYIVAVAAVVLLMGGAAEYSVQSSTCMACHPQEANFSQWMRHRLAVEKKGFSHELIGCADCHIQGATTGTALSGLRGLLHVATYLVPQIDPRKPRLSGVFDRTRIPSENCQSCHRAAEKRKAMYTRDLTPALQKIGLTMDHRKHVLARDDTCARCHERYKDKASGRADRDVNYAEVNHLACDSCHTMASHAYRKDRLLPMSPSEYETAKEETWQRLSTNPRWMVAIPSEEACQRCHNGKIHFKTKIFLADCRNGKDFQDCAKCHPLMTKEYFEQYRREREKRASASNQEIYRSSHKDPAQPGCVDDQVALCADSTLTDLRQQASPVGQRMAEHTGEQE